MPSTDARLRAFIERGYRPQIKSHLLAGEPREGWAVLHWREYIGGKRPCDIIDGHCMTHRQDAPCPGVEWLSEPRADSVGWQVDAHPVVPGKQSVFGGVHATFEEALAYAERELDKYAPVCDRGMTTNYCTVHDADFAPGLLVCKAVA